MLNHMNIDRTGEFFSRLSERENKCAYACRITGYSAKTERFLERFYKAAAERGLVLTGPLPTPDFDNLAYFRGTMGDTFQAEEAFLRQSLGKWLPRVKTEQRNALAGALYDALARMKNEGKNEHILKNAYTNYMCWLYYKFERILNLLGEEELPKLLYEGGLTAHSLQMLSILNRAGCDVVILEYAGEAAYLKTDPRSAFTIPLADDGQAPFPDGFSLEEIRKSVRREQERIGLYGSPAKFTGCTNLWLSGNVFEDICKEPASRGNEADRFYNCFCRVRGCTDKLSYKNELYQLQTDLKKAKRKVLIVNEQIEPPLFDEIKAIKRNNSRDVEGMIRDLLPNISCKGDQELTSQIRRAFIDLLFEEGKRENVQIGRLANTAVSILCWLNRYRDRLFDKLSCPDVACFIYLGGCRNESEALFCRFLARLPVDVLILVPDLQKSCCLEDPLLYETTGPQSADISKFPENEAGLRLGTTAYNAEQDLNSLMYGDTGLYRNQQFTHANTIILQTMYEEIAILWDQELKYRPNFSVTEDVVNIPVIFAKVSGVKNGAVQEYWSGIKKLVTEDTLLIQSVPRLKSTDANPLGAYISSFLFNGRLQVDAIKSHASYPYGFLRESVQDRMFEKLTQMLDSRIIKGTFENGTEYKIVATVLNLERDILRMIQSFDFTKKNPKLIYLATAETLPSLEDAICAVFLNMLGFDILFFAPTGYQCIEQYLNGNYLEEYQIGEYMYDLRIPNLTSKSSRSNKNIRNLFRRGN